MKKKLRFVFVGVLIVLVSILIAMPVEVAAAPKGKVVVVNRTSFVMNGGDCHTHRGSSGTSVVALLHDGLMYKGEDSKIYPAIAKRWEIARTGNISNFSSMTGRLFQTASRLRRKT